MNLLEIVTLLFSAFLGVGAYFGFKKGSTVSLVMGLISCVLMIIGAVLMHLNLKNGLLFLLVIAGLLVIAFLQRLLKTKNFMPSGILLAVTLLCFIYILVHFLA